MTHILEVHGVKEKLLSCYVNNHYQLLNLVNIEDITSQFNNIRVIFNKF